MGVGAFGGFKRIRVKGQMTMSRVGLLQQIGPMLITPFLSTALRKFLTRGAAHPGPDRDARAGGYSQQSLTARATKSRARRRKHRVGDFCGAVLSREARQSDPDNSEPAVFAAWREIRRTWEKIPFVRNLM
jgi:hypothetical protein